MNITSEIIDREALRILNDGLPNFRQVRLLGTLTPQWQEHYRALAARNLGVSA